MLQKIIQEFGRKRIIPYQKQWEKQQALPHSFFNQLDKLGVIGSFVPKKYGGLGLSLTQYITVIEEFAKI